MKKGDFVFVYGTLRRGQRADLQKQSHNFGARFCGEDHINGRMYHLGAYPGVKAQPVEIFSEQEPVVTGEVFNIRESALVAIMDTYEGYCSESPETGYYNRIETRSASGKTVWVYTFNGPVMPEQLIDGGDWCKNQHLSAVGRTLQR